MEIFRRLLNHAPFCVALQMHHFDSQGLGKQFCHC